MGLPPPPDFVPSDTEDEGIMVEEMPKEAAGESKGQEDQDKDP